MQSVTSTNPAVAAHVSRAGALDAWLELSKARLSALVVLTTAVGYYLPASGFSIGRFLCTVIGTAIAAAGANALNQCLEVERDGRMERTRNRPLPSGRLTRASACAFGIGCGLLGPALLALTVNMPAALLCLATVLLYVLVYTPLKPLTTFNTFVGAVVGGIPPMIGWVAATGRLDMGAWLLGAILFVWQIPHFLALAWLYREDYERGGYRMLPVIDRAGLLTCAAVLGSCLALAPLTVALTLFGVTGWAYAGGALLCAAVFAWLCYGLFGSRSRGSARRVFLASVIYLPILLLLMVLDRGAAPQAAIVAAPATAAVVPAESRLPS